MDEQPRAAIAESYPATQREDQAVGRKPVVAADQLDPLQSPVLAGDFPGLLSAFDPAVMRAHLEEALCASASATILPRVTISRCRPAQAVYHGDGCLVRYELEVNTPGGQPQAALVIGRIFSSGDAAGAYLRDRLAPLAAQMTGRTEIAVFASPIGIVAALNMAVSVFPIDGELPMLVAATDRQRLVDLFNAMLPDARDRSRTIQDCQVELGHYGRQHRCVLRYHLTGTTPDHGTTRQLVYGKVAADKRGALAAPVIAALGEYLALDDRAYRFNIPRALGYDSDLHLALFEAIPGVPQVAQLLKARLSGADQAGSLTLEQAIVACARIAATLHTSRLAFGTNRTIDVDLAELRAIAVTATRISPALGAQFLYWLDEIVRAAAASPPLALSFAHGDFSYTQLIFDGAASGLVDFDTVCQAEPALDLGQFLAYVRVAVLKPKKATFAAPERFAEQLCAQFLSEYSAAMGERLPDPAQLRVRVALYERISLLRLALHSWQKLKGSRLDAVLTILEERMTWQA